jgi:hypothetical protein
MKILQTLTRLYISREQLAASVKFYETQFQVKSSMRVTFPEVSLEAVQVGPLLLFAGSEQALAAIKGTHVNVLVDSVKEWYGFLNQQGVVFLEEPHYATTGWEMRVQNPDGVVFKYVEPSSGDGSFYQDV